MAGIINDDALAPSPKLTQGAGPMLDSTHAQRRLAAAGPAKNARCTQRGNMPKAIFIEQDDTQHSIEIAERKSLMEGARRSDVPGIEAECGGCCSCATCHVYIDEAWLAKTGSASEAEIEMLQLAQDVRANSRLSCQIRMTADLDGIVVRIPASQAVDQQWGG